MNSPYRHTPSPLVEPILRDPVRAAQAHVLEEVANGLRMLNENARKGFDPLKFSALDYERAVGALQNLHDSIVKAT